MQVATHNGVKVYNLSAGKTLPMWLSERKRRALNKDEDYRRRIELIQDFEFSTACQRVKVCEDGEHIVATGTYPPTLRCFTVSDLSMKFERRLTCEIVDFEVLGEDYSKLAILQADRTLAFHAAYGAHYDVRIPKFGRTMAYQRQNCNLYIGASANEVYALNLDVGVFKAPLALPFDGCNVVKLNPAHALMAAGGESTIVQMFDTRSDAAVTALDIESAVLSKSAVHVSTLQFDTDGLTMGVGTNTGHVLVYDIRSSRPLHVKEHQYGLPIVNITFHNGARKILSADKKVIKIWEREGPEVGSILTNIETPADINDVCVVEDKRGQSGLLFVGGEQRRIMSYFVPQLGAAPRWCSFLESLTEELEEQKSQSVYEDYKFITRQEVDELGISNLIGTPLMKGYMHGFFIDMSLYTKLRAVANPFEYEEWRRQKIREKIDEKRKSRISQQKRLPKVNAQLAAKLLKTRKTDEGEEVDTAELAKNPTGDDRFTKLFTSPDFEVNTESEEFKMRHPSHAMNQRRRDIDSDDEDAGVDPLLHDFERVESSDDGSVGNDDDYDDHDDEEDEASDLEEPKYVDSDEEAKKAKAKKRGRQRKQGGAGGDDEDGEILRLSKKIAKRKREMEAQQQQKQQQQQRRKPNFFELSDAGGNALFVHTPEARKALKTTQEKRAQVLSDRLKQQRDQESRKSGELRTLRTEKGVVREYSFVPKGKFSNKKRLHGNKK